MRSWSLMSTTVATQSACAATRTSLDANRIAAARSVRPCNGPVAAHLLELSHSFGDESLMCSSAAQSHTTRCSVTNLAARQVQLHHILPVMHWVYALTSCTALPLTSPHCVRLIFCPHIQSSAVTSAYSQACARHEWCFVPLAETTPV